MPDGLFCHKHHMCVKFAVKMLYNDTYHPRMLPAIMLVLNPGYDDMSTDAPSAIELLTIHPTIIT